MLKDDEVLKFVEQTPELKNLVVFWWGRVPYEVDHAVIRFAHAFHAHEQRVRADEREACAKLCEELRDEDGYEAWNTECAAAIRARKEKE